MNSYVHTLTLVRTPRDVGSLDDYGQPTAGTPSETSVRGLLQPRTAREVAESRSAGAEIGTHVIFLPLGTDIVPSDAVIFSAQRYEVTGIREHAYGGLAHLEVDARAVGTLDTTEVLGS